MKDQFERIRDATPSWNIDVSE